MSNLSPKLLLDDFKKLLLQKWNTDNCKSNLEYNFCIMDKIKNTPMHCYISLFNPIKPNVFWIVKNPGGGAKRHPLEINKGAPWDLMLLKVILKPIKVMITCKKLAPYLKISMRYWHLKIWRQWDFVIPWPTKIAVTRSIFEIEGSNFGFSPLFVCSTNAILQLRLYDQFLKKSFF